MAALISSTTSIVQAGLSWMGSVVTAINAQGNELVLMFVLLPLIGTGIGILKRMING